MKKLILKSILASIFMASLIASPAIADELVLKGYGAWRDSNNGHGEATTYRDIIWSECRRYCLESSNCKGVEYSLRPDGFSLCEVHTDRLHHIQRATSGNAAVVWIKTD